jgi:hypothetical protein
MNGWCAITDCTIPTEHDYCEAHTPARESEAAVTKRHDRPPAPALA